MVGGWSTLLACIVIVAVWVTRRGFLIFDLPPIRIAFAFCFLFIIPRMFLRFAFGEPQLYIEAE